MRAFIFLTIFVSVIALSCACLNDHECNVCSDGYQSQCVGGMCTCDKHICAVVADCPEGENKGCPAGQTDCVHHNCVCNRH